MTAPGPANIVPIRAGRTKPATAEQAGAEALDALMEVEHALRGIDLHDDLIGAPLHHRITAALQQARHDGAAQVREQIDARLVADVLYGGHDQLNHNAAAKVATRLRERLEEAT